MSERFNAKNIKARAKNFLKEHKQEIKDYLPLAATIVSLGITAAKRDVRIGAIAGAAYLGYDKTKDQAQRMFEERREKKKRKQAFADFPEEIKKELTENEPLWVLQKDAASVNKSDITSYLFPLEEYQPAKIYIMHTSEPKDTDNTEEHAEGNLDEESKNSIQNEAYKIGLHPSDVGDFGRGIISAHYILRKKLEAQGKSLPSFSGHSISAYNKSLRGAIDNFDSLTHYYSQEDATPISDTESLEQTEMLLEQTSPERTPMMTYGAMYLIGLYERHMDATALKRYMAISTLTSVPETMKEELIEKDMQDILEEELDLARTTPPVTPRPLAIRADYQPETFYLANIDEQDKKPPVLALFQEDMSGFLTGILYAHYIIRNNDSASPQISQQTIDAYNTSLVKQNADQDTPENIFGLLTERGKDSIKNKKLVHQLEDILSYNYLSDNQMIVNSALYMIGLYEKQQRINVLERRLFPPTTPPTVT